jgi:iron complex outermembrane receptor protein
VDQYDEATGFNDADTLTDYSNYGIRARQTVESWSGGELIAGIDYDTIGGEVDFRSGGLPISRFEKIDFRITSPYVAVSHRLSLGDGWSLTPSGGARHLFHSEFADEPAWQLGLVADRERAHLHAAYSRSASFPGIYVVVQDEEFLPGENGWRDLGAETIQHVEVGAGGELGRVRGDLTLYRDSVDDRIVVVPAPPFPPALDNVGSYTLDGVEMTLTWTPSQTLALFGGINYLDADRSVPYAPEWQATLGVNLRASERMPISVDALYVDDQLVGSWSRSAGFAGFEPVGAYLLFNARIGYILHGPGQASTEVYLFAENLTDEEYELKSGYPMPGINGRLGVAFRF